MADDIYVINTLAPVGPTVTINDTSGIDWLVFTGSFPQRTAITLQWSTSNGQPNAASGSYFPDPPPSNAGGRLIVNGVIENARGSNGRDDIIGNILDNIIYGDNARTGAGGDDVIVAGGGNDTVYGGSGVDQINGDAGNDRIYGDSGSDTINGDAGIDRIAGGSGADFLSGGSDLGDSLDYRESTAGVTVSLTFGATTTGIGGHAQGDRISGFTDVFGSDFDDVITDTVAGAPGGNFNSNAFYGYGGDDILRLGGADDRGYGGNDDDTIYGGDGTDRLYGQDGLDRLYGEAGNDTIYGGDGNDTISGSSGRDTIHGDAGDDKLFGGLDTDIIEGGSGKDSLKGGVGADRLYGGTGPDSFAYDASSDSNRSSYDIIYDFSRADKDKIDLTAFDGNTSRSGDQAFAFIGTSSFSAAGQLRYVRTGTDIVILGDTNGDKVADFHLRLEDVASLSGSDFLF